MGTKKSWLKSYRELKRRIGRRKKKDLALDEESRELFEKMKAEFVEEVVGEHIGLVKDWLHSLERAFERAREALGAKGVMLPKEFKSFFEDPEAHLRKKLFIYAHDLIRGRLKLEEFESRASAAVKTSLMTNARTLYQTWVYACAVTGLAERGYRLVYPDDLYLHIERTGKQKAGAIPPNAVLSNGYRAVSLFIEAPRPLGWEDSGDLSRVWGLYVALRPDMLAYGGRVLNIVDLSEPTKPISRPDMIIECKELSDWYERVREIKGPIVKPLTAEEWRHRWLVGLWDGLAEVLGVEREEALESIKERKGLRLRDRQIVLLYKKFYEPRRMILVSRAAIPREVKEELEGQGVEVVDGVEFDERRLSPLVDALEDVASIENSRTEFVELTEEGRKLLAELSTALSREGVRTAIPRLIEECLRLGLERRDLLLDRLRRECRRG